MWDFQQFAAGLFSGLGGSDGFDVPGGGNGEFLKEYSCYPVSFKGREELERGNKILLPQTALGILARLNVTWPMLFEISNTSLGLISHGGVLEFIAEEGTCYMPYWMMKNLVLKEGDIVQIKNTSLPKGTYVKLQPVTKNFLDISNPKAVLETSLRHFAALTVGDNIVIVYNQKSYEIEIVECRPSNAVSIIETDIQVDFSPPKDYVEPSKTSKKLKSETSHSGDGVEKKTKSSSHKQLSSPSDTASESSSLFSGTGVRVDGKPIPKSLKPSLSKKSKSLGTSSYSSNTQEFHCGDANGDHEQSIKDKEPWKRQLKGGVRKTCSSYDELLKSGKIPGMVGKRKPSRNAVLEGVDEGEKHFDPSKLFQGKGYRLDKCSSKH